MAKPKKFRVAVSGDTIDGRKIEPLMLTQAVETFNPATYGVRVNVEHIRGLSGDKPFGAVGDVVGLSVQEDDITIAGKTEKRTALYAEIQPNDRAIELNKADQKVYSSVELLPNYANSGKWGLVGLAVTDTPASIATERLQFSKVSGSVIVTGPDELKFDDDAAASAFSAVADFFKQFTVKTEPPATVPAVAVPAVPATPATPAAEFAAMANQMMAGMKAIADAVQASSKASEDGLASLRADHNALKTSLENQESPRGFTRAPATGSDGNAKKEELSDF